MNNSNVKRKKAKAKNFIVHTELNGQDTVIFVSRNRGKKTPNVYKKFVDNIVQCMTEDQLNNAIKTYNGKAYITLDDVLNSFEYYGEWDEYGIECICGVSITYNYYIYNTDSGDQFELGSTCIEPFEDRTVYHYTETKTNKTLRTYFNVLKENYYNATFFMFGKYKHFKFKEIVKSNRGYCIWMWKNTDDKDLKQRLEKLLINTPI